MAINVKELQKTKINQVEELKKALQPTNGDPAKFTWKDEQADKFIDYVKDETGGLLKKIRTIKMKASTMSISKIIDGENFLKPSGTYTRDDEGTKFTTTAITLTARKVEGKFYLDDDELEDNIEGKTLEQHLQTIVAKKIGNELLETIIYGRRLDNPKSLLKMFNGVKFDVLKNGNYIDALTLDSREVSRGLIVKGKKAVPAKYRKELELIVGSDIKIDIDELYNDPSKPGNTEIEKQRIAGMNINENSVMRDDNARADTSVQAKVNAQVNAGTNTIPVDSDLTGSLNAGDSIIVNASEADEMVYEVLSVSSDTITINGTVEYDIPANSVVNKAIFDTAEIIYTNPKNIILGIRKEITVEFERIAPRGYNVWYSMRLDTAVENPQAICVIDNVKSKNY